MNVVDSVDEALPFVVRGVTQDALRGDIIPVVDATGAEVSSVRRLSPDGVAQTLWPFNSVDDTLLGSSVGRGGLPQACQLACTLIDEPTPGRCSSSPAQ